MIKTMSHLKILPIALVLMSGMLSGCMTLSGDSPAQKRQSVLDMKNEVLTELFKVKPDTRNQVGSASGYAVFSNVNVNIIFASFSGGYGVAKNNQSGKYTYMQMGELGLGLGAGVKDFRVVFVFHSSGIVSPGRNLIVALKATF